MSFPLILTTPGMRDFAEEVDLERQAQIKKFGDQHRPLGMGDPGDHNLADMIREASDVAEETGHRTWRHVILEEVYEALAERDPVRIKEELTQVAAVCQAIIHDLPRQPVVGDDGPVHGSTDPN